MQSYSPDELLRSLVVPPPVFDVGLAERLAEAEFGIQANARSLGGERDRNFLVRAGNQELLLKVANEAEPDTLLEMQNAALRHIEARDPSLPVPRLRQSCDGADWVRALGNDGKTYRVRLLTYLPGKMFSDVDDDARLLHEMGAIIARLDRALQGFFHASADHPLAWDLKHAGELAYLADELDPSIRQLAKDVFDRFSTRVAPALAGLRGQIIHNDVSFHNAVVSENSPHQITGVYDFGDLIYAPLIQELAVSASEIALGRADPIAASVSLVAGFHAVTPLTTEELSLLPDLVAMRLALSLSISRWRGRQERRDGIDSFIAECADMLSQIADIGSGGLESHYRAACGLALKANRLSSNVDDDESLKQRRAVILGNAEHLSYDRPLHTVRGEGTWLFDGDGRAYLDAYNNVPHVGHCHPRVVTAIAEQAAMLNTNTRYLFASIVEYSERITATLPEGLDVCLFVSSGSEANDLAWRIAKTCSRNSGGLVMERAYHGVTEAVMDLSPYNISRREDLAAHIETLAPPDDYRGEWKRDDPERGQKYAGLADQAIERLRNKGHQPAAVMVDSILSSNGIMVPAPGYLAGVFDRVRAAGGLCIADEVQSGFGRLGSHLWGFETGEVVPDIVTFGKPIGNGHPMGLVVTTRALADSFGEQHEFFSTTAGNPVSCTAALAVLDVIEREFLKENALRIGTMLSNGIRELGARYPIIGDVRGAGLFIGVELVRNRETLEPATGETRTVVNLMREDGVLIGVEGAYHNVLKIRPPLVFWTASCQAVCEHVRAGAGDGSIGFSPTRRRKGVNKSFLLPLGEAR